MGATSLVGNLREGNWGSAAVDAGGLLIDAVAAALPIVPAGAAAAINANRAADKIADAVQVADTASGALSFGRNANQTSHTFRHVEAAGLSRTDVQGAVAADLKDAASKIEAGKPLNQTITVGDKQITYTAYQLKDGSINVGRITVAE